MFMSYDELVKKVQEEAKKQNEFNVESIIKSINKKNEITYLSEKSFILRKRN